jgi:hypothetical protein
MFFGVPGFFLDYPGIIRCPVFLENPPGLESGFSWIYKEPQNTGPAGIFLLDSRL